MARTLTRFTYRRMIGATLTAALLVALFIFTSLWAQSLRDPAVLTGIVLLAAILFLAAYQVRKKLTHPPLLRSARWLQLHIYVALGAVAVFALHTAMRWPTGVLEIALWLLFVLTAASGVFGLFITRMVPPRLAGQPEQVIYERIPLFRRQIADEARQLVADMVQASGATTLGEFYHKELAGFFRSPRNYLSHLFQSDRPRAVSLQRLHDLRRYLTEEELRVSKSLEQLMQTKHVLDYHTAMQGLLKAWLFVHIPLTYMLLAFAAVHVAAALAMGSGW